MGFASIAAGQDKPKTGFVDKTFKNADGTTSPYVVFVPQDYDGTKEYPVILFLHGAGETKNAKAKKEGKMPVEVGIGPAIKKREKTFPFIVVIPQAERLRLGRGHAPTPSGHWRCSTRSMKEYKIDAKRQYLTGLSMGGMGTWSIAMAMPDRFAAIVPDLRPRRRRSRPRRSRTCRAGPSTATRTPTVNVNGSRDMIEAIKKAGGNPKYTEYPGVGHNSWDKAYGTDELYTWLLEQKKK